MNFGFNGATTMSTTKRKLTSDDLIPHPRKHLRIEIPSAIPTNSTSTPSALKSHSSLFSTSSLFDDDNDDSASPETNLVTKPAMITAPPIPGLCFIPTIEVPPDLAEAVMSFCMLTYFTNPNINQIMLFTRFSPDSPSSLPPILLDLLSTLSTLLRPHIPDQMHSLLFPSTPTQARQVILNLYTPGEGISPHVDLLKRFGDGIIGVSFGSGCVMRFERTFSSRTGDSPVRTSILEKSDPLGALVNNSQATDVGGVDAYDLYLPERSILILTSDARYRWTHGIGKQKSDFVTKPSSSPKIEDLLNPNGRWISRGVRLSVTFRWLLPGADVVGDEGEIPSTECK